jgi:hypothetical protein
LEAKLLEGLLRVSVALFRGPIPPLEETELLLGRFMNCGGLADEL